MSPAAAPVQQNTEPPLLPAPQEECGPGSRPETGIQGRVSRAEHESGRAARGYTCNTEAIGHYGEESPYGTVAGFKVERYVDSARHECAYYDTTLLFPTNSLDQEGGVNVLDMSDPANPVLTDRLLTPAMLTPHESLVLSQKRGILAAVAGGPAFQPGIVDVYDVSQDCRHPVLKSSSPVGVIGHESGMAPDGRTFYSASPGTQTIVAVDISNPSAPEPLWYGDYPSHGLSISDDGRRAYVAGLGVGQIILDVSEIQDRVPNPEVSEVSRLTWNSRSIPQNSIPITIAGRKYTVEVDEFSGGTDGGLPDPNGPVGAARIIDIEDEEHPRVVSNLRLEVHQPENRAAALGDPGADNPAQGYGAHYCNVPTRHDPGIVACSMILSGLRVFDIRDPLHPKEIAYFNSPIPARFSNFPEASNWAMSSPSFAPERGEIWYSDGLTGFWVVRLTGICKGQRVTISGTAQSDELVGTRKRDIIEGLGGRDEIRGRGGKDVICGNRGRDLLRGQAGEDKLFGSRGKDRLFGGPAGDLLVGGARTDSLFGAGGRDRLRGGSPNAPPRDAPDLCRGGAANDKLQNCER